MTFIFKLDVIHVIGHGTPGFKLLKNDEGFSGETCNVGSCNDPATSIPVVPLLVASC